MLISRGHQRTMVEQHIANSDTTAMGGANHCIPTILAQSVHVGPKQGELLDEPRVPSFASCHDCCASPSNPHTAIAFANTEPAPRPFKIEHVAVQIYGGKNLGLAALSGVFEEWLVGYLTRVSRGVWTSPKAA